MNMHLAILNQLINTIIHHCMASNQLLYYAAKHNIYTQMIISGIFTEILRNVEPRL